MYREAWLAKRALNINSTEVSVLFDMCPYDDVTLLSLWLHKKNKTYEDFEENFRMTLGRYFEPSVAKLFSDQNALTSEHIDTYMEIPDERIGSSFDYKIVSVQQDSPFKSQFEALGEGLLEIKIADSEIFKRFWCDEAGNPRLRKHIRLQVQHQMMVSGLKWAVVVVAVGYNKIEHFLEPANLNIQTMLKKKIREFWKSVDDGIKPQEDPLKDYGLVSKMMMGNERELHDASEDQELCLLVDQIALIKQERDDIQKTMLDPLENREKQLKLDVFKRVEGAKCIKTSLYYVNTSMTKDTLAKTLHITPDHIGQEIVISPSRSGYRQFRIKAIESHQGV
jgi:predicted phage-related endonuclease